MDILQKEAIIAAFEREKINVEITENKKGQIVVSRMCELRKEQVFADEIPWDDTVEQALKEKVSLTVKPDLRKMIIQEQLHGKAIKPIITLAGPPGAKRPAGTGGYLAAIGQNRGLFGSNTASLKTVRARAV